MGQTFSEATPRVLKAAEAASFLRIGLDRLYELCRRGEIPCFRLGQRQLRFDRLALERWIAEQQSRGERLNHHTVKAQDVE